MMEMIERYIYAVTHRLPEKGRAEVELELKGLIEEMLEERLQGKPAGQADINSVLLELGRPERLAREYGGKPRYLIGPDLFDSYLKVLKVVLSVLFTVVGVAMVIKLLVTPQDVTPFVGGFTDSIVEIITGFIVSLVEMAFQAFVWVTLSFAVAEYFGKGSELASDKDWTPADLEPVPDEKKSIPLSEPLISIGLSIVFLALYLMPHRLGIVHISQGTSTVVIPIVNPEQTARFLPLVICFLGIGIVREVWKLAKRRWTMEVALGSLLCNAIAVTLAYFVFANPEFWNPNFIRQLLDAYGGDGAQALAKIWSVFSTRFFHVVVIAYIIDTITAFYRALR